jgi:hypothetical protein
MYHRLKNYKSNISLKEKSGSEKVLKNKTKI